MELIKPELSALPEGLLRAATQVGATLADSGHRSWIVGGAVRDLCMGRVPSDVDIATDALPEVVEECFPETVPLGRRFGTVLVKVAGLGIEVTTLRAEGGYSDNRRPDEVVYGTSAQEDAQRRDFTCNAMYLDTQSGEFLDPAHGLADLASGLLVCVGDALQRFREDGLRIMRLARFASTLGMQPGEETLSGARSAIDSLQGVSGERVMAELERGFASGGGGVMLEQLARMGVQEQIFPSSSSDSLGECLAVLGELGDPIDLMTGVSLFVDPSPLSSGGDAREGRAKTVLAAVESLRPSREFKASFLSHWQLCGQLEDAAVGEISRGDLILLMREDQWPWACSQAIGVARANASEVDRLLSWHVERQHMRPSELFPEPWIGAKELGLSGLPQGPRWGEAMREALRLQLGGEFRSPAEAQDWLKAWVDG